MSPSSGGHERERRNRTGNTVSRSTPASLKFVLGFVSSAKLGVIVSFVAVSCSLLPFIVVRPIGYYGTPRDNAKRGMIDAYGSKRPARTLRLMGELVRKTKAVAVLPGFRLPAWHLGFLLFGCCVQ